MTADGLLLNDEEAVARAQILDLVEVFARRYHATPAFEPGRSGVAVSGRVYDSKDMRSLVDSALDFWLTTGRFNDAFEAKLAKSLGAKHALSCNSGSSANLLAMSCLTSHLVDRPLVPGDEVITCATGFPTTLNPIFQNNLVPVFVDVELPTYNIDVSRLEDALSPRTRAVMIAHTLGNPFNLAAVTAFCRRHDLYLVEDCCDALGARYDGRQVGGFGVVGTLSFYPAHHITMGEGGAVFTNNGRVKRALESIRDWGRDCWCAPGNDNTCKQRFAWQLGELPFGYDHKYTYSHLGYNLKITDMQAAVGLSQLDKLEGFIATRRHNFQRLWDGLSPLQDQLLLPRATENSEPSWFGFPITVRDGAGFSRDALTHYLHAHRIGTRLLFGGNLTRQPYVLGRAFRAIGPLERSDTVMHNTFWIGVYPGIGDAGIDYVIEQIAQVCAGTMEVA